MLAYFDQVMQQRFLTSGRVRWFAMSGYAIGPDGKRQVRSLTSGNRRQIAVRKKVVDATHAHTAVPSNPPAQVPGRARRAVPFVQGAQRPDDDHVAVKSRMPAMLCFRTAERKPKREKPKPGLDLRFSLHEPRTPPNNRRR